MKNKLIILFVVFVLGFMSFCVGWASETGLNKPGILGQKLWTPRTDMTTYPNFTTALYAEMTAIAQNLEDEHQFQNTNYHSSILNVVSTYIPAMEKESRTEQKDDATHYTVPVVIANHPDEPFTGGCYLLFYYPSPGELHTTGSNYMMRNIYAEKPTSGAIEGENGYTKWQEQKFINDGRPEANSREYALIIDHRQPKDHKLKLLTNV